MKLIIIVLIAIVVASVGYAILGKDMFLVSNEPLATEEIRNFLNETEKLPDKKSARAHWPYFMDEL